MHFGLGFADGQAADGVAVERDLGDAFGGLGAHRGHGTALDDAKEGLALRVGFGGMVFVTLTGPVVGALHGVADGCRVAGGEDALVEAHDDVGADAVLVGDGGLRGKEVLAAVDVGPEGNAGVVDASEGSHAEGLVPAAVGEDGAVPTHESVQAAGVVDALDTGAKVEVIGVAEDGLGSQALDLVEGEALDGGLGGDGHEQRRLRRTVGRGNLPAPRGAIGGDQLKADRWCVHLGSMY